MLSIEGEAALVAQEASWNSQVRFCVFPRLAWDDARVWVLWQNIPEDILDGATLCFCCSSHALLLTHSPGLCADRPSLPFPLPLLSTLRSYRVPPQLNLTAPLNLEHLHQARLFLPASKCDVSDGRMDGAGVVAKGAARDETDCTNEQLSHLLTTRVCGTT